MMRFNEPIPTSPISGALTDHVRLAAVAYLGRFKGSSREHTESDLRCYPVWCAERGPGSADCAPC
jgi:integrase/recombinase XerD